MNEQRIALASDHAGFEQKQQLASTLTDQGYQVLDLGPVDDSRVDYPDYASRVGEAVIGGKADVGILICGTGIGMAIAANKIKGVRAANVTSVELAALAREHNDANILALSARFVKPLDNARIAETFLTTAFAGGRHAERIAKISGLE